jgi:hypothetical protein
MTDGAGGAAALPLSSLGDLVNNCFRLLDWLVYNTGLVVSGVGGKERHLLDLTENPWSTCLAAQFLTS